MNDSTEAIVLEHNNKVAAFTGIFTGMTYKSDER